MAKAPAHRNRALAPLFALAACLTGCAHAEPRFEPEVQAAVTGDMRRLETEDLILYYPEGTHAEALRIGERIDRCVRAIRAHTKLTGSWAGQKPRIVLPAIPYNNAFVVPASGQDPISVVPEYDTADMISLMGLLPDPGVTGCHEVVHYVHSLQVGGFGKFMTTVFGPLYTPQGGLESWFHEGLAVYYETKLQPGTGRLRSRYFQGILAAGVAEEGIDSGTPHVGNRDPLHAGQYLVGSAFIDWLVSKYGEEKLFQLIRDQGTSFLFPLFVETRFKRAYDKGLTTLYREFVAELSARYVKISPPADQRTVLSGDAMGRDARYTRGRSGHEAMIVEGVDRPTRLVVRAPDGTQLIERNLTDVLPGRTFVAPSVSMASGLSFTADGKKLYFVMIDRGELHLRSRLVVVDVETHDIDIVADDLRGSGGSIAPDGKTYYFARAYGDAWGIAAFDIATKSVRWLRGPETRVFHTAPRVSPDGKRLAVLRASEGGARVAVVDADSGALLKELDEQGSTTLTPDWLDDGRVVYSADVGGRMQVFVTNIENGDTARVTSAPYLALSPQVHGNTVRFLNRKGWVWTLDEAPLAEEKRPPSVPPLLPSHAAATAIVPPTKPTRVISDESYSSLERLFFPQVRTPWIVARSGNGTVLGLGAMGSDPLGRNRWAVNLGWNIPGELLSGSAEYVNGQLAPVLIAAGGAHYATREQTIDDQGRGRDRPDPTTGKSIDQRETVALLAIGRQFFDSTVLATGARVDAFVRNLSDHSGDIEDRRMGGYFASLSYAADERTPYTGRRRALAAELTGTMFPRQLGSNDFSVGDGRASLDLTHVLLLRRLVGNLNLTGRYLAGVPRGVSLLQIGGGSPLAPEVRQASGAPPLGDDIAGILPPGVRFLEPLAGFENLSHYDRGAALGEVSLRYPIIADWGSLSTFYILPSFLLRQVDLVAFADGARFLDRRDPAAAVGGRVLLRIALGAAPITAQFQVARRLTDDEEPAFYFTLLLE